MNRRAFVLGAAMVLLGSLVAVALRSFAEATFLKAYGTAQAPWLLIATAAGFAVATLGYDALTRLAHPLLVDRGLLVVLAVVAATAPTLLAGGVPPVAIVIGLTAASQVANLALWNRVAAAVAGRDARRMLPRAGAAVTLGGAIAGLGAGVVIPRAGLAFLPHAGAAATVLALLVCIAQERALVAGGSPGGVPAAAAPRPSALSPIQRSLLAAMIATAAIEALVTTVIDLEFLANVKSRYAGDHLAVALALFYGGTNGILFLLQVTAVPRILVTRSLPFTAAIHPALVILAYLGFAVAPGFAGIAATRTADQVLRLATSRTSQELALSALPPGPRARWKVLLRGLVYPAGVVASALVLFALGPAILREPAKVAVAAIGIALVWASVARTAARRFQSALAAPLRVREARRDDPRQIDLETLERWTHAAGAGDLKLAPLARAALARARIDPSGLADHLRHDEPEVRAAMFDQLARTPVPALRGELRAAIAIEANERALALGIKALTIAGDASGERRGLERAGLSLEIDAITPPGQPRAREGRPHRRARRAARGGPGLGGRDPAPDRRQRCGAGRCRAGASHARRRVPRDHSHRWTCEPWRTRRSARDRCAGGDRRRRFDRRARGRSRGRTRARARQDGRHSRAPSRLARSPARPRERCSSVRSSATAIPRWLTPHCAPHSPSHAAARELPSSQIAAAFEAALAALAAHLDARDAAPTSWSACARVELEVATRRCVARVLWASAVEAAALGRDPAPIAATARHLLGGSDADRKRALDLVQELQARPQILELIERWIRPPVASVATPELAPHDAWLARLVAGELAPLESTLVALRAPALFASLAGPALAALAARATLLHVDGVLFLAGDPGETMYVVTGGALIARRADDRRIAPGGVVGELAVLTHAARAAKVLAAEGGADVLVIDRAAFAAAALRAPELVLGLSATLAGWLAPTRPDVL